MSDKLKIYIAGAWESKGRIQPFRDVINALPQGYEVVSSWLNETGVNPEGPSVMVAGEEERANMLALRDVKDIYDADMMILDTLQTNDRGGKDFESGLAHLLGLEWWIVGPRRNVFQTMASSRFDSWDEAIEALKKYVDELYMGLPVEDEQL